MKFYKEHRLLVLSFVLAFMFVQNQSISQNLQGQSKNNSSRKIKFSGGLNLMSQYYNVKGIDPRRSPFSWVIGGNAMVSYGKFRIPLSFSFRDQKFSFGGPSFNKFGISPRYKWAKLLLGYRSMRFSKYSLNGKTFFGAGIELKPKYLRFSAFKGKLKNPLAQKDTLVLGGILISTYDRDAYGVKLGFGNNRNHFDISYLKIKDNIDSDTIIRYPNIKPVENLVIGTDWSVLLFKRLSFLGSANASAYSENLSLEAFESDNKLYKFFDKLYDVNTSTKISFAGDLALNFNLNNFNFGLQYRRVEPNYRSLGISFIQADIQSYTANTNINLFKRKLILNARAGIEQNNLRKLDYLTRKRFIHSYRINYIPGQNFNILAHFANYQYESTDGLVAINDTLRQVNVSRLAGLNASYNFKGERKSYGAFINFQRQIVRDQSPIENLGANILNNNFSIGGVIKWNELDFSLRPSINYSSYDLSNRTQSRFGFGLSLKKILFEKKLNLNFSSKYAKNKTNSQNNGYVLTNRLSAQYKITKKQVVKFRIGYLKKSSLTGRNFNELRSTLHYSFKF